MMRFENVYDLLLEKAKKVYDARREMHTAADAMYRVEGIDVLAGSLSADYIQSLKDHSAIKPLRADIKVMDEQVDKSRLVSLLTQAQQLMAEPKLDEIKQLVSDTGFQTGLLGADQPDLGESGLVRQINFLGKMRVPSVHRQLIDMAREQAATNTRALDSLEENLKTAEKKIRALMDEIGNFEALLTKQTTVLQKAADVPLDSMQAYRTYQDNAKKIAAQHVSITALEKAVSTAKQDASDSLRFAAAFESKDTTYGTRYEPMKEHYVESVDPLFKKALEREQALLLLENEYKKVLRQFSKSFKKAEKEEKQYQEELAACSEDICQLVRDCNTLADDCCFNHLAMLNELTGHRGKVFDIVFKLSREDATLKQLEEYAAYIEDPCRLGLEIKTKLDDSRKKSGLMFLPLGEKLNVLSQSMPASKVYEKASLSFKKAREQFTLYAVFQDSSVESLKEAPGIIKGKIEDKRNAENAERTQLVSRLLSALKIITDTYDIAVPANSAGNLALFDRDEEKVSESDPAVRARVICLAIFRTQRDKKDGEWAKVHQAVSNFFIGQTHQIEITEEKLANLLKIVDTLQPPAVPSCASTPIIMRFASSP